MKTSPIAMTPLMLAILRYGNACDERGRARGAALRVKKDLGEAKREWAIARAAADKADALLREINNGFGHIVEEPVTDDDLVSE